MKAKLALLFATVLLLLPCAGCAAGGDAFLLDIRTNYLARVTVAPDGTRATNWIPQVTATPRAAVTDLVQGAGGLGGPWGVLIATALTGALGFWARHRQRKINAVLDSELEGASTVNEVLAQSIEVARELLKNTPQGQKVESRYLEWLKENQQAAGVLLRVRDLVDEVVQPTAALQEANKLASGVAATAKP